MDPIGDVLASLDYPMVIVTTTSAGARAGRLVGFHTQCSIDPLRYLVCISVENHTLDIARTASASAVHFLTTADVDLARLFGEVTGAAIDKLDRCHWFRGPFGLPILSHRGVCVAGRIVESRSAGDHVPSIIAQPRVEDRQPEHRCGTAP